MCVNYVQNTRVIYVNEFILILLSVTCKIAHRVRCHAISFSSTRHTSQANSGIEQCRTRELYQCYVVAKTVCHSSFVDVNLGDADTLYLV